MDQHLVFAISREYGSGGREIGERLASELGDYCGPIATAFHA